MSQHQGYLSFNAPEHPLPGPMTRPPDSHRPPPRARLLAFAIAALALDVATVHAQPGLGWTMGVLTLAAAFVMFVRPSKASSWAILVVVGVLACCLSLRESPWLTASTLLTIIGAFVLAATLAHDGSFLRLSAARALSAVGEFFVDSLIGWAWASGPIPSNRLDPGADIATIARRDLWLAIARGLLVAVPLVVVLGGLLSSADDRFADLVAVDVDLESLPRHVVAWFVGYLGLSAFGRRSAHNQAVAEPTPGTGPAATANLVLSCTAALFGLYAASRMSSESAVATAIRQSAETTWASQARAGFFQLLAVAAIMATVLLSVRSWSRSGSDTGQRWVRRLATINVLLLLGIVMDAYLRLRWYENAYGWTMLRLYCVLFATWLGIVFVLIGASFAPRLRNRPWLTPTVLTLTALMLVGVNIVNPEAIVADRNLTQPTKLESVDADYLLVHLSADAIPTMVDHLDQLDSEQREAVLTELCQRSLSAGGLEFNVSRARAESSLEPLC